MQPERNAELAALYEADQADRRKGPHVDWSVVGPRDEERRRRVRQLIEDGALRIGEDHFHAAMVFQHGSGLEDFWQAHELAKTAVNFGYDRARWLTAAAYDRWLMNQGRPQKYGTQYQVSPDGVWILYEVDPATTDAERAEWNVRPLAEALKRLDRMNARWRPRRWPRFRRTRLRLPGKRLHRQR